MSDYELLDGDPSDDPIVAEQPPLERCAAKRHKYLCERFAGHEDFHANLDGPWLVYWTDEMYGIRMRKA